MRVLIVGCGYVGVPLGAELARQGHRVFGLRRSSSAASELKAANIEQLLADITRPADLAKLPCGFDWIVNCVASGGGTAGEYQRVYLEGMRNLLGWIEQNPPEKFVYTSSTSVYGQNDGSWVDEDSAAEPEAETSRVLVEAEKLLFDAFQQRKFPATVLRLAGIYGPGRGYWFKQFLQGEARIEGAGGRILNMIHRDDVVSAIIISLQRGRAGEVYNVVDNEPVTQRDFFQWFAETLGRSMPPVRPEAIRRRGATNKKISNEKTRRELNWFPKFPSFREGYASEIAQGR